MTARFDGKTAFITGAAGFLGSHLTTRLLHDGASVVGVDNLSFARPDWSTTGAEGGKASLQNVDLRNGEALRSAIAAAHPDIVFHLAAVANPRTCKQDFPLAFDVNVLGTQNVFRHAPPTARVVFMSSAAVYGAPDRLPIDESHPRKGSDPYSITKIMGEDLAGVYRQSYDRNIVIVRNFNTFGVGQTGDYIVPQLIRQAITEHKIEVWDPSTVRDLMFIDDTIEALLTVAAHTDRSVVNVGAGRAVTVGELAASIAQRVGGEIPVIDLKKKVLGSPALVSDNSRLRALGWSERVGLDGGIDRTISWTRTQLAPASA